MNRAGLPKLPGNLKGANLNVGPPRSLVAATVEITMMVTAQRHGQFVAHLASKGGALRKFEMMGVARRAFADQAGLTCDEGQMGFVSPAQRFGDRRTRQIGGIGWRLGSKVQAGASGHRLNPCVCRIISAEIIDRTAWQEPLVGRLDSSGVIGRQGIFGGQVTVGPQGEFLAICERGNLGQQLVPQPLRWLRISQKRDSGFTN
jgi:hypothetical protein